MRKIITGICAFTLILGACAKPAEATIESDINTCVYEESIDYMELMMQCAAAGDINGLKTAVDSRNEKIQSMGLNYPMVSVEEFLKDFNSQVGFDSNRDYMADMMRCCLTGNFTDGTAAAKARNKKIEYLGLNIPKANFEDMYLVSKIITAEAGSYWLSMDWKMTIGEVLLNRVSSPEFPNSVAECIYQPGQYYGRNDRYFAGLVPYETCVIAASRLMNGERIIGNPSVVFQANFPQGGGVCVTLRDRLLGTTYLCYTNHPELYRQGVIEVNFVLGVIGLAILIVCIISSLFWVICIVVCVQTSLKMYAEQRRKERKGKEDVDEDNLHLR